MSAADHGNQHQKYNHLSRGPDLSRMYLRSLQSQADTHSSTRSSFPCSRRRGPAELASHFGVSFSFLISINRSLRYRPLYLNRYRAGQAIKNEGRPARDFRKARQGRQACHNDGPRCACDACFVLVPPPHLLVISPEPRCTIVFARFHLRSDSSVSIQ